MRIDQVLQGRVYGWAYRLLQNHHDALDATQEVLLRALRQPGRDVRRPAAWLLWSAWLLLLLRPPRLMQ